ncbi:hypothetical protein DPEC_G00145200 [Dallia pectoralis]|uniref:Uncharacterized protein n=1 Tax=Dallia pectoralis TaxID=75939 RepID=A0ACC2GPF1_DALPE|nr:hypothetical protein DPEC_G00145200 [Dallia pectoralis]
MLNTICASPVSSSSHMGNGVPNGNRKMSRGFQEDEAKLEDVLAKQEEDLWVARKHSCAGNKLQNLSRGTRICYVQLVTPHPEAGTSSL